MSEYFRKLGILNPSQSSGRCLRIAISRTVIVQRDMKNNLGNVFKINNEDETSRAIFSFLFSIRVSKGSIREESTRPYRREIEEESRSLEFVSKDHIVFDGIQLNV